ncbi:MAG: Cysteinyl-tRNA synthetase (EC [uncultured Thiotrichaceae bacterium]|uniref:Cysteine--tRNA ligase n=1 Tax=uncultured Thiotrichaceae bacterium TaxID=298394 RepID=A0A6S6TYZ0_9GAMM|nr:MAG: Cysteinyl-tRNA synthetase (EC [uncultured Thiotrichaceae bacterium]
MTVYDYCHLGHARVMVVFDMVYRYLQTAGYEVTYVRNITDIDDKIIKRANENNEPFTELTERFIAAMHEDEAALGILKPTVEPRATGNIPEMLGMISQLIEKGYAYVGSNNDVYYSVAKFEGYGKLSGRKLEDLRAGERIAVDQVKYDPLDFVLWKAAKPEEPAWDSPWGRGRPGWHIECSAMAQKILGDRFDIHGGGHDLQFPHHENEIAQSEACIGHQTVNYWMHNGFIRINDEKMSKSLNNFSTIRQVLEDYRAEEVRYFILNSHYRSPLNYSQEPLDAARAALTRLYTALRGLPVEQITDPSKVTVDSEQEQRFRAAMDDDFNTVEAISVLFELAREVNRQRTDENMQGAIKTAALLKKLAGILGLLDTNAEAWFKGQNHADSDGLSDDEIETMIRQRTEARTNKDWAACDALRDELKARGIVLEDGPGGTSWRRG